MRSLTLLAAAAAVLAAGLVPAAPATASGTAAEWGLDAPLNAYAGFGGTSFSYARCQTFVATASGRLETATFRVGRVSDHDHPLRLSLYAVQDGTPGGEPIYSEDFPASMTQVDGYDPVVFAFAGDSPRLQAGSSYALSMEDPASTEAASTYVILAGSGDDAGYAEGDSWRRAYGDTTWAADAITDFAFRITVADVVPVERASWGGLKRAYAGASD